MFVLFFFCALLHKVYMLICACEKVPFSKAHLLAYACLDFTSPQSYCGAVSHLDVSSFIAQVSGLHFFDQLLILRIDFIPRLLHEKTD